MQNALQRTEQLNGPAQARFDALVDWMASMATTRQAPGFVIGISGTDSILAFLVAARAMAQIGQGDRVLGIHYGAVFPPRDKTAEETARITSLNPSYRWVAREIIPWLRGQAPQAQLLVDDTIDYTCDHSRWAALFKSSLNGASRTEMLSQSGHYWVVGTRNATEDALGTYANLSAAASVQPLIRLWKSDVLSLCQWLGVPQLAIDNSRQVDCDCGRYDLAADHIEEVDMILKARAGQLAEHQLAQSMPAELRQKLSAFVDDQIRYAAFKKQIPYCPPA